MSIAVRNDVLSQLRVQFGLVEKLPDSRSLYSIPGLNVRIYFRYSKVHGIGETFYGLRDRDLQTLEGFNSFICFLCDKSNSPIFVPYSDFEQVFNGIEPADDGQFKVQIYFSESGTELYIARAGRFSLEACLGWESFNNRIQPNSALTIPELSHSQVQSLVGAIGAKKEFDIWIPVRDRHKIDWNLVQRYECKETLPSSTERVRSSLEDVDVVWLDRGSDRIRALFEVEHTTPIYSGLLRFNDIFLTEPRFTPRFCIVSNEPNKALFTRQVNRETFVRSGLREICTFHNYIEIFNWYQRL